MAETDQTRSHLGRQIGKFRLERLLGAGAMGEVFLGTHVELGNLVAVKLMSRQALGDPNAVERFFNEARAVAAIDQENVAKVIDHDRLPDGTPYIVMEYVEGRSLRELLHEQGRLPLLTAVDFALDVLAALAAAHARHIVHRDLKPENIRVTPTGRLKVLDFGVSKQLDRPNTALTMQGAIVGTPHYMSPEQVLAVPIDGRADLYSLGVILYECVVGQRPFESPALTELLRQHVQAPAPSPRSLRPDCPAGLEAVIARALEKQPALRFSTATEMATALETLRVELPTPLPQGPAPQLPRRSQATPALGPPLAATEAEPGPTTIRPPARRGLLPAVGALGLGAAVVVFVALRALQPAPAATPVVVTSSAPAATPALPPEPTPTPTPAPPVEPAPAPPQPAPAVLAPKPPKLLPGKGAPPRKAELVARADPPASAATPEPNAPPKPSGVQLTGVTLVETGRERERHPPDYDPTRFDALAYLARARALAQARMSDVVLVDFSVEGVFADGHADLTLSRDFTADYFFRSPSRSVADPRLSEDSQEIPCLTYVVVSAKGVEVYTASSFRACREKPLPAVSCPLPKAAAAAVAQGGPPGRVAKASWLHDGWYFDYGSEGPSFTVRCPSTP